MPVSNHTSVFQTAGNTYIHKASGPVWVVTEEAAPLLLHTIVLKHVKEASVAQLMEQHLHVLEVKQSVL